MYQYDDPTVAATLPTPAAPGTPGYFTDGSAGSGTPATILRSDFMNMVMLELTNVVLAGGLTPSKTTYTQVRDAINAYVGHGRLARTSVFINVGSTANQQVSIDGGAFTTTGATTWTPVSASITRVELDVVGAAGAGGGTPATTTGQACASPGGGAGARGLKTLTGANIPSSAVVTIGIGGLGSSGAAGFNGTTSSFGSLVTAPGGTGGNLPAASSATQIVGGTAGAAVATGGDINLGGEPGFGAESIPGARAVAGNGGSSVYGSAGTGQQDNTSGTLATGYGAGGAGRAVGASAAALAGTNGMNGIIIVREFF